MDESLETLLRRWREGDRQAGDRVIGQVYSDLRRLAAYHFKQERDGHTLQPTALVNEVFIKLASGSTIEWQNRSHFFAVAARQMRLILIDHARRNKAQKRQETLMPVTVSASSRPRMENILEIDGALRDLEHLDSRAARVVELRVFGGLKESEIAEVLEVSVATVKRDWTFAKAWLISRLEN
jgi:RNA polymerase sigma factor (TIGR02999 family)